MADGDGPLGIVGVAKDFGHDLKDEAKTVVTDISQQLVSAVAGQTSADPLRSQQKQMETAQKMQASRQIIAQAIQKSQTDRQQRNQVYEQPAAAAQLPTGMDRLQTSLAGTDTGLATVLSTKRAELKGNKTGE